MSIIPAGAGQRQDRHADLSASNRLQRFFALEKHERVVFHENHKNSRCSHFTVDGKKVPGLHTLVDSVLTVRPCEHVPQPPTTASSSSSSSSSSSPSSTSLSTAGTRPRRGARDNKDNKRRRKGVTDEDQRREIDEARQRKQRCCDTIAMVHGKIIDEQFSIFVECEAGNTSMDYHQQLVRARERTEDPCTGQLRRFVGAKGWRLMASQFRIASDALGMATAVDFLATNRADTECYLCELKVTTARDDLYYLDYRDYIAITNEDFDIVYVNKNSTEEELSRYAVCVPNSQYTLDMIQLLLMKWVVETEYGMRFDNYYLVRVQLMDVMLYPYDATLNKWFDVLLVALKKPSRGLG